MKLLKNVVKMEFNKKGEKITKIYKMPSDSVNIIIATLTVILFIFILVAVC